MQPFRRISCLIDNNKLTMRKKYLLSILLFLFTYYTYAQRGKDGAKVITASEIVNAFTMLTVDATAGSGSISVTNSALSSNFSGNLAQGDLLMLIQVQGTSVEDTLGTTGVNPLDSSSQFFKTWGRITNYNNCGNHEFVQVSAVPNGTTITLDCSLQFDYTALGKVLVIRVPRYSSLTINNGGTLITSAWNGTSGGILAVEVNGITTINSGGSIDVSNLGFRGGTGLNVNQSSVFGGGRFAANGSIEGGEKGEGIAGDQAFYDANITGRYSKGAAANAGGGGNGHNAGGGGGSNAGNTSNWNDGVGVPDPIFNAAWALENPSIAAVTSSGGGRGGYSFFDQSNNPLTTPPGVGNGWGGDNRREVGGLGGRPLDYSTGKIFIGGGGGAGEGNDGEAGDGGNGGGIIFMSTYGDITGAGTITANGEDGGDVVGTSAFNQLRGKDAGGGAGGGGTIILQTTGSVTLSGNINANGGIGGDQTLVAGTFYGPIDEGEGPGGGGGGGYIAISAGTPTRNTNGGISGVTNCPYVSNFTPNGATGGGIGMPNENINSFDIVVNGTSICTNTTATLTASLTGNPPAGTSIEWFDAEFGGTLLFTGASFTTSSLATTTTYWVRVCPAPYLVPVTVTVNPCTSIIASLSATDSTLCLGDCINFNDLSTGVPTSWTWYFFGSTTANSGVQNPTNICYNTAGSFNVALVATNASAQDSIFMPNFITVSALPTVVASATDTNLCLGEPTTLSGSGATSYTWDNTVVDGAVFNPIGTTLYTVTGTDANGCIDTDTLTINVNALPTVVASATDTNLCLGDPTTLSGSGATSYTWDNTIVDGAAFNPIVTALYTVTGTDANGCIDTDTLTINVNTLPTTVASATDTNLCLGEPTTLSGSGATSYTWDNTVVDGAAFNPIATTLYTVTGTDVNGCVDTDTLTINVNALPTVVANATNTSLCTGDPVTLTGSGATSYTWDNSVTDGTAFNPVATQTYTVTGTDANGCTNTDQVTITVSACGVPPVVSFNASDSTICLGDCINFNDLSTAVPTSWTWYFFGSATANSGVQNPTFICYNTAGSFDVALVASNATGQDSLFMPNFITVNALPTVTANATDTIICLGDSTILLASGANTYQWFNNLGQTVTDTLFPSQSGFYLVQGSDINGCVNTDRVVIQVNNCTTPVASISNISSACINDCLNFTDNSTNNPTNWTWYFFGGNPATSIAQNPTNICYDSVGTFAVALVASNAFGQDSVYVANALTIDSCVVTATSILIPNVLTPNSDGQNDIFVIDGVGITAIHTQIYNRWGMLLFESNIVHEGWDGRTRAGKEAPEGTYFYIITAKFGDATETFKGSLTLIR